MSKVLGWGEEAGREYCVVHQLYGEGRRGESGTKWKQMGKVTGEEVEEEKRDYLWEDGGDEGWEAQRRCR